MVRGTGPRPGMPDRTPGHKAMWRDSTREGRGHSCHCRPHSCVGVTPCFRGMPGSCLLEVEKYVSFNCSWSLENPGRGTLGTSCPGIGSHRRSLGFQRLRDARVWVTAEDEILCCTLSLHWFFSSAPPVISLERWGFVNTEGVLEIT